MWDMPEKEQIRVGIISMHDKKPTLDEGGTDEREQKRRRTNEDCT